MEFKAIDILKDMLQEAIDTKTELLKRGIAGNMIDYRSTVSKIEAYEHCLEMIRDSVKQVHEENLND